MQSGATLRSIKLGSVNFKLSDQAGMCISVTAKGTIKFRFDARTNNRRDTLFIGCYGTTRLGMSFQIAQELWVEVRRAIAEGRPPSQENRRTKRCVSKVKTFEEPTNIWLDDTRTKGTTRSMQGSVIAQDMTPANVIHLRDSVIPVFAVANLQGDQTPNPADGVSARRSPFQQHPERDRGL